jgi:hypothetical protein
LTRGYPILHSAGEWIARLYKYHRFTPRDFATSDPLFCSACTHFNVADFGCSLQTRSRSPRPPRRNRVRTRRIARRVLTSYKFPCQCLRRTAAVSRSGTLELHLQDLTWREKRKAKHLHGSVYSTSAEYAVPAGSLTVVRLQTVTLSRCDENFDSSTQASNQAATCMRSAHSKQQISDWRRD